MNYIFLVFTVLFTSLQNVTQKAYNDRTEGKGTFYFAFISSLAALLFFLAGGGVPNFEISLLPYSIGFGLSYATALIFTVAAISFGSMSLTSLIISYSLMIPTLYGLLFLNEPVGVGLIPGILLLVVSLFLVNKKDDTNSAPITGKWLIAVFLAFVGNGMCSTVQKMQQVRFDGAYKNEFMIIAIGLVVIITFSASLFKERRSIGFYASKGTVHALLCGLMNGTVNLLVMIISGKLPASVMFPLISGGGIILTFFMSKFVYKEKMSKKRIAGLFLGIGSVVLLNI